MTSGGWIIREARSADIPAMVDLLAELFALESDFEIDPDRQRRGLEILLEEWDVAGVWVADADGRVVGMCTVQVLVSTAEGGPVGLVEDVVVTPAFRGQGVGRALLEALESWAAGNGLLRLQLLAERGNTGAQRFYGALGWQETELICLWKKGLHEAGLL